jgi:hypothetical protein
MKILKLSRGVAQLEINAGELLLAEARRDSASPTLTVTVGTAIGVLYGRAYLQQFVTVDQRLTMVAHLRIRDRCVAVGQSQIQRQCSI